MVLLVYALWVENSVAVVSGVVWGSMCVEMVAETGMLSTLR